MTAKEACVLKTILTPGTTVFPTQPYTLFNETFEIFEGEIDVWNGDSKITLTVVQLENLRLVH
jgi:hypothetical protein